jgi:hypothetical protein
MPKNIVHSADVPTGEHYLVVVFGTETVHIPGDERSRTSPGHGYPADDRVIFSPVIRAFPTIEECRTYVDAAQSRSGDIAVLKVERRLVVRRVSTVELT